MLVQGGTGDIVVEDAHLLAEQARRHGVDVTLELYPMDTHDIQVFWSFLPEAAEAVQRAGAFAGAVRAAPDEPAPRSPPVDDRPASPGHTSDTVDGKAVEY